MTVKFTEVFLRPLCTFPDFFAQIKRISQGIHSINAFDHARSGGGNVEIE
jgi:hypothetical protein